MEQAGNRWKMGDALGSTTSKALIVGGLLAVLYGYLYGTLRLENYALLMGSVGLFVVLAAVMFMTRKVDWCRVGTDAAEARRSPAVLP